MLAHLGYHGLGQRPLIEGIRPLCGQGAQHLGQCRVGERAAGRPWCAVGQIEVGAGIRVFGEIGVFCQQGGEARADDKPLLREGDGGLEQRSPGQLAIALMGQRQRPHCARRADRATAHHAVIEGHGLAILHEQLIRGGGRGRLATIHSRNLAAIPYQQQGAATDTGGLRLHQGQYQLHGDGGIHGAAARPDDLVARIHCQRIGRSHHEAMALPALFICPAAGGFRGDQGLGGRGIVKALVTGATGQEGEGNGQPCGFEQHDTLLVCFMSAKDDYVTIGTGCSSC
ncbi:hypothetical protein LMBIIBHN_02988 [Aeromonas salmonicida]